MVASPRVARHEFVHGVGAAHSRFQIVAMIKFYFSRAPNPRKVALFLEEAALPYEPVPVDTRMGEQHVPAFTELNPNAKVPVIQDGSMVIFDSSAILLYLAEKTGRFLSVPASRGQMLSWLMFIASGIGPYTGQCVHFRRDAPERVPYAIKRYEFEAWRHWEVLESRLATRDWMIGERYTILDMAVWGWARSLPVALGDDVWTRLPRLKGFVESVETRPATRRALAIESMRNFKTEMDAAAQLAMFPHLRGPSA